MMAATKALPIVQIERCTTILKLNLVVSEHPVPWCGPLAPPAINHGLTLPTRALDHCGAPLLEL